MWPKQRAKQDTVNIEIFAWGNFGVFCTYVIAKITATQK